MADINKQIEEEAREYAKSICYPLVLVDHEHRLQSVHRLVEKVYERGYNSALHSSRWRKVSEEMPEDDKTLEPIIIYQTRKIFRNLACKDAQGRFYIKNRVSIDNGNTWNWQFEDKGFEVTEWKPID